MIDESLAGLTSEQLRAKRMRAMNTRFEAFGLGNDADAARAAEHIALIDAELVTR